MIGPLIPMGEIPAAWDNVLAVILGMGFGFVLEASGFSSSRKIIGTFFGYDFVVLKVFFTAAITSMLSLLYMSELGLLDFSALFIQPSFILAAVIGGIVMGMGFAMGGYCPGTSFCGLAIGKLDAFVFTIGMFAGIFFFSEAFTAFEWLYSATNKGAPLINESLGLSTGVFALFLIIVAIGMFVVARIIQSKVKKVEY